MSIPTKVEDRILWFENHAELWVLNQPQLGITLVQAQAVSAVVTQARIAFTAARNARLASEQATIGQGTMVSEMNREGRELMDTMKAFIEQSGNPELWALAGLKPPQPRSATPPPTAPFSLAATLDSEGNLLLRWKASQPRGVTGVVYFIRRSLEPGGGPPTPSPTPYALIDTVGEKEFHDKSILEGTRAVSYIIQAKRGSQISALSPALTVRFGRMAGGGMGESMAIESISSGPAPALAA